MIESKINGHSIRMVYFHLQEDNRITGGGSNPGNLGQDVRDLNNSNLAINTNGGKVGLSKGSCN